MTNLSQLPGRNTSTHPERRLKPAHARRSAPAPSDQRVQPGEGARRTAHLADGAAALGAEASGAREGAV